MGEDLAKGASGGVIRDLADPQATGQPSHYDDYLHMVGDHASLEHATQIWFSGFGEFINSSPTMCDARNSTIAAATVLYPGSPTDIAAAILAWQAVGLGSECDPSTDFAISLSHPTIELAPGASGQTAVSLDRGSYDALIDYAVTSIGPATVSANPASNAAGSSVGTTITVDADPGASGGTYPILITASGAGADPH
jgi:hypothetical protein